tara:strand:- start:620 stop:766 length:147 start_codon:yes stop_codon:yes gene_type:complete
MWRRTLLDQDMVLLMSENLSEAIQSISKLQTEQWGFLSEIFKGLLETT